MEHYNHARKDIESFSCHDGKEQTSEVEVGYRHLRVVHVGDDDVCS